MRAGKEKYQVSGRTRPRRNLPKSELGGVIFGCTHATKDECLRKQLFGLPSSHFSYVRNIEPGLPLFLFNYSSRKLDGIYEAASQGQMVIDLKAWTTNGTGRTAYPAQVRVRTRTLCQQLDECDFCKIIKDNYHKQYQFWFELDHAQTSSLIALFKPLHNLHLPAPNPHKRKELAPALESELSSNESKRGKAVSVSEVDWSEENILGSLSGAAGSHLDGESRSFSEKVLDAEVSEVVLQNLHIPALESEFSCNESKRGKRVSGSEVVWSEENIQGSSSGASGCRLDGESRSFSEIVLDAEVLLQNLQKMKADCSSTKVFADDGDVQGALKRLRFTQDPLVLDEENKTVGELPLDMHEESRLQESREHKSTSSVLFHDNAELVAKGKREELDKKQAPIGKSEGLEKKQITGARRRREKVVSLPEDVIALILLYLPVKNMIRLKAVCKVWRSMIINNDHNLLQGQIERSKEPLGLLVLPADGRSSGFVPCHFLKTGPGCIFHVRTENIPQLETLASRCAISHCDGLLLLFNNTEIYLCNPAAREIVSLPKTTYSSTSTPNSHAVAIGHDPIDKYYKVVRLLSSPSVRGAETLILGPHPLKWVPTRTIPPHPIRPLSHAVVGGVSYWLVDDSHHPSSPNALMSFNLANEEFDLIPPPANWSALRASSAVLTMLKGLLCCTHRSGKNYYVSTYSSGVWTSRCTLRLSDSIFMWWMPVPLGILSEGELLFRNGSSLRVFDSETGSLKAIPSTTSLSKAFSGRRVHIIPYSETAINIRGIRRKKE